MNEQPFLYVSGNGSKFSCDRADFGGVVVIARRASLTPAQVYQDLGEMIAYHVLNIRPQLNGFAGYDCVRYAEEIEG